MEYCTIDRSNGKFDHGVIIDYNVIPYGRLNFGVLILVESQRRPSELILNFVIATQFDIFGHAHASSIHLWRVYYHRH